jgi:AbrB family looped-hinge helix DNA binding protein
MGISYYTERIDMRPNTVTLSPKYQVVIPRRIRENLRLRPGERFHVINYEGRVELIPVRKMREMRGFLRGMDSQVQRDEDRV